MAANRFDESKDYFAVLGVHPQACDKTIKLAYRRMARRYHPDVSKIHNAVVKFQEISEAFEVLTKHKEAYYRLFNLRRARSNYGQSSDRTRTQKNSGTGQAKQKPFSNRPYSKAPLRGKDRVITYPLTLRYAIRLLKLGYFYIPGLKVRMKFTREALEGKTFRIKGRGYPGLFGGENGDYHVKFKLSISTLTWELKGADIYGEIKVPATLLNSGSLLELDSPSGIMKLVVPEDHSQDNYIRVDNMGLPADLNNTAGHLYTKLVAA